LTARIAAFIESRIGGFHFDNGIDILTFMYRTFFWWFFSKNESCT